jgi:protein-ribulosamine 3-kinase
MPDPIAREVSKSIGSCVIEGSAIPVGGGSIHQALRYCTQQGFVFLKVGAHAAKPMFESEAAGLRELARAGAIRVPHVLALGAAGEQAFLCLEWLELVAPTLAVAAALGERLAALHRIQSTRHGWTRNNFIGRTPQRNDQHESWSRFFREQRLLPQLELAANNHAERHTIDRGYVLADTLDAWFSSHQPVPSLLHGDLWGGNWGATRVTRGSEGEPVLFDPAVYFGDREADIAMTRLFGGFPTAFYDAYETAWPLDPGAQMRVTLYNLYHVLNHYNLFGGGYLAQARAMIDRLLAEVGH